MIAGRAARNAATFGLLAAAQLALSLRAAATIRTVATYDTAYYYVVARSFAQGRGLTDTVLWHFLGTPEAVKQPAGGYWEIGWPLFLGSAMRIFGHSQRAAILICAALSTFLPLGAALVGWLCTRRVAIGWVSGLILLLQVRLLATNITPDATLMYQLACLGALAAFYAARDTGLSRSHLVAAGAAIALPMYVRGEGFVVALATVPLLLLSGERPLREDARRTWPILAGMAALALPFAARNLLVLGHLLPPARSLRLWMTSYGELFQFASDPSPSAWWAQGISALIAVRLDALVAHLEQLARQLPWPLVALAALGAFVHLREQGRRALPIPLFVLLSWLVPCATVPIVASVDRFVMNLTPALAVLAAIGAVAIADAARRILDRRAVSAAVIAACVAASTLVFLMDLHSVRGYVGALHVYRGTPASLADPGVLAPLALKADDVVLTDDPWRVAAVLDVATVMCPMDGTSAAEMLIARYRPRFMLVSKNPTLQAIVAAKRVPMRVVARAPDATWYELTGPTLQ